MFSGVLSLILISCTNVFRIQRAGGGYVVGAGDDRAAVGKNGDFVGRDFQTQQVLVQRDRARAGKAPGQVGERNARFGMGELHGVATTKHGGLAALAP